MKSDVAPLLAAVVLALAGAAFWTAGQTDRRVTDVRLQLATLQYGPAGAAGEEVAQSLDLERRVPVVGKQAEADVRDATATAKYWQADFAGIAPQKDATGAITETDPAILLLSANAAFRASQTATDRSDVARRLDSAIKSYADVLKADARQIDAAFNYEYTVRLRDALAKTRPTAAPKTAPRTVANADSDLPAGPTLHGHPGGPPQKTDMSQFKIVIPKRGEERKDNPEAGKGGTKVRKG
jgi:hypothetical protein